MKDTMVHFLDIRTIEIVKGKSQISLLHYHTYYLTIYNYALMLKDEEFSKAREFKERFREVIRNHKNLQDKVVDIINSTMILLGTIFSNPDKKYYWFSIISHTATRYGEANYLVLTLHETKAEIHNFSVNDDTRPAFKLGFPLPHVGVNWFAIKLPDDGIRKWVNRYEVYIQSHALERLMERMDCMVTYHLTFELFFSLFEPVIIYENGRMLITYSFGTTKMWLFRNRYRGR